MYWFTVAKEQFDMFPFFLILLLLSVPGRAQQPDQQLTLAQAEQLAIQNNPQFSAARFNALAAYQVPLQYRAGLLPNMGGSVVACRAELGIVLNRQCLRLS